MVEHNSNASWIALGEIIRDRRLKLGLTQIQLADLASLPRGSISKIERGEEELSDGSLKLLSDALKVSLNTLIQYREQGSTKPLNALETAVADKGPYRGLSPFREQDSTVYFGRKGIVNKLISKLEQNNLVGLVGASGSGKSSLVAAGLIPTMRETHNLQVASFRPGRFPFESLAVAIAPIVGNNTKFSIGELKDITEAFHSGSGRLLIESIQQGLQYDAALLLVIDQFEELYAQCEDLDMRKAFTTLLLDISKSHSTGMVNPRILITIRGDYLGNIIDDRNLAEELEDNFVYLPPMAEEELREAIKRPAELFGVTVEPSLVDRIIHEAGDEPGVMPLIQYCLSLLWQSKRNGEISNESYEQMGGLEMAIANQAERVYSGLGVEGRRAMRRLLSRLIRIDGSGTEGSETRRKLALAQVSDSTVDLMVIEALVKARLLTTDFDRVEREETIELAHEAIIRHWKRLRTWLIEDRQFLLWQQTIEPICEEWIRSGKEDTYVLRGRLLEQGEEWDETRLPDMQPNIREYLQVSQKVKIREASARAEELAMFLLRAKPEDISELVAKLRNNKEWIQTRLKTLINELDNDANLWRLRLILLPEDPAQMTHIINYLMECEPNELPALLNEISAIDKSLMIPYLNDLLADPKLKSTSMVRAVCVLALIDPTNKLIEEKSEIVAKTVVEENPLHMLVWTNALSPVSAKILTPLKQILTNEEERNESRDAAALVLNQLLSDDPVELAIVAVDSSPRVFERFFDKLEKFPEAVPQISKVLTEISTSETSQGTSSEKTLIANGKRKAFAAIINSRLGDLRTARAIFKTGSNPEAATQFVYYCRELRVGANELVKELQSIDDPRVWYWVTLALGQFEESKIETKLFAEAVGSMKLKYAEDPSPGVHSITGWLLYKWGYGEWLDNFDKATFKGPINLAPNWFTIDGPCGPIPFVKVPIGNFMMGSSIEEDGAKPYETPIREIVLTRPYAICAREITREEFSLFESETGFRHLPEIDDFSPTPKHPVVAITWNDCLEFLTWLESNYLVEQISDERQSSLQFTPSLRLPTEAEWERACRAGTTTPFNFGSDQSLLIHHAWYFKNSGYQTTTYRTLPPNQFGIFNMHGNCWEWCSDFYSDYNLTDVVDPNISKESDRGHILRGGCWNLAERYCRSACRNWHVPSNRNYYNGLRVVIGYQ